MGGKQLIIFGSIDQAQNAIQLVSDRSGNSRLSTRLESLSEISIPMAITSLPTWPVDVIGNFICIEQGGRGGGGKLVVSGSRRRTLQKGLVCVCVYARNVLIITDSLRWRNMKASHFRSQTIIRETEKKCSPLQRPPP